MWATRATVHSLVWALLASCAAAFIVPEELVSFLSIVYSNIPPIRKGTDSRVGVGFRLGPHADAQIVLELGPQTNTRPLGAAGASFGSPSSSSKRHAPGGGGALPDPLQDNGVQQQQSNPAAGSWLSAWRTSVRRPAPAPATATGPPPDDDLANQSDLSSPGGPGPLPDPTKLTGAPLVSHLRQLYRAPPPPPPPPPAARQPEPRQPPQPERHHPGQRQPARQPGAVWPKVVTAKPSKYSKVPASVKTVGKQLATTTSAAAAGDLSDVSLD
ncbi:Translation initiation factor IF-2 [Frankliniella fusca]|uniref:Translation initiation factor IF-2 n=1 Tax=Frankliniella fusca TaxID=407009 RepID=A0AAE1GQ42_9NEOP|nr:Translation initiation factor IF-2 [Frankliniella fusca]